jgi:hypothetical protein
MYADILDLGAEFLLGLFSVIANVGLQLSYDDFG